MHLKDHVLRAFIDRELSDVEIEQVQEHLLHCSECQTRLDQLSQQVERVNARLAVMAPGKTEQPHPPQIAYQRFIHHSRKTYRQKETIITMLTRRPLWTALAVIVVIALVFTITPANAWASSFLGLFRVQKVQVISFNPSAAENAKQQLSSNEAAIQQVFKDDLKITSHGKTVAATSAAEAAQKAGFTPRIPGAITGAQISVRPGMNAVFTINQPKLQALMDAVGVNAKLPESTNGKTITADVADAVVVSSAGCPVDDKALEAESKTALDCTELVQLPSPVINTPEGLNVQQLGQAMFQFLGMSPADAEQISQRIDWTSTLILPIPQGSDIQYQDVQVDGVPGTFLEETGHNTYGLVWVKDGIIYGLHGTGGLAEAQAIVESLH